jgi:LPS-assembly protein
VQSFIKKTFFQVIILLCCFGFAQNSLSAGLSKTGVTLFADNLFYDEEKQIFRATQNVVLVSAEYMISAEEIVYDALEDRVFAKGSIIIQDIHGNIITGSSMVFKDQFKYGLINNILIKFSNQISIIAANKASRLNDDEVDMEYACYTACSTKSSKPPIWQIKSRHTKIDTKKETITYQNVHFEVFGIPVLFLPYFSHPTPNAKAKSGFLPPSLDIKNLKFPIYFRAKSNLDFIITPRVATDKVILEGQIRHLTNYGKYNIDGSIVDDELVKNNPQGQVIKDNRIIKYHLFANGLFHFNSIDMGFNVKKTSDPAYLKKYYNVYDPYLASTFYVQNIDHADYSKMEILYFEDMRSDKLLAKNPFAAPLVKIKRVFDIDDSFNISIDSNNLFYKSGKEYEAGRSSNIFNFSKTYQLNSSLIELNFYDKIDAYKYSYDIDHKSNSMKQNNSFVRNIPEIHINLLNSQLINNDIIIEPVILASTTLGEDKNKNILPIDSEQEFELNDVNLMEYNRFSGRDNNEIGKRVSYGVNLQSIQDMTYAAFVGKNYSETKRDKLNQKVKHNDIVGNASITTNDSEFYYRFNLSNKFKLNMHEIGSQYTGEKFSFLTTLFEMYRYDHSFLDNNLPKKVSNFINQFKYNLNENWSLDFGSTIDLAKKPSLLMRSIGVTYEYDCVRISAKISDNFTQDITRDIKKSKSNISIKIGLKTLNM